MADTTRLTAVIRQILGTKEDAPPVQIVTYVSDNGDGTHRVRVRNPDGSDGPEIDAVGEVRAWAGVILRVTKDRKLWGPDKWGIIGPDVGAYVSSGIAPPNVLRLHGPDHGFDQPDETTNLHTYQVYSLRTNPYSGLIVRVWVGLYGPMDGKYRRFTTSYVDVDLTGNKPGSDKRYVTLSLTKTGTVTKTNGEIKSILSAEDIPLAPPDEWVIAAIWIDSSDTVIPRDQIEDLRFHPQPRGEYPPKTGWGKDAQTEIVMSWNDGTRTLTLTPTGSSFTYWIEGRQYIKTAADTVTIDDAEGLWYIYYDGDTLTASQVIWIISDDDKALVALMLWDAANNLAIGGKPKWEMHGWDMDAATHNLIHYTIGTRYELGLAVSENPADRLEVGNGIIHDEDILVDITDGAGAGLFEQPLSPLESYKLYKLGAGGDWRHGGVYGTTPVILDGGNDVQWNEFVAGAWQLTAAGANQYCVYWVIATPDIDNPIMIIVGQGTPDSNINVARLNNPLESLDMSDHGPEYKPLARVMMRNIVGGVFYEVSAIDDFRTVQLVPGTGVIFDHGALAGRADDIKGHPALYSLNMQGALVVHKSPGITRVSQFFNVIQDAIDAAVDGDAVWVFPGTYAEDITMKAGVAVIGLSRDKVIISGGGGAVVITVAVADAVLANLSVISTSTENAFVGVGVGAGGTDFVMRHVTISVTTSGTAAFGVVTTAAVTTALHDCEATGVGGTAGYGVYTTTAGAVINILFGEYVGSTTADIARAAGGTINVSFASYGSISGAVTLADAVEILASLLTVDGSGSGLDADKTDGFHAPAVPAASNIVVLDASGDLIMPDGSAIGQAAGPWMVFDDTNNYLEITGCYVSVGTNMPDSMFHVKDVTVDDVSIRVEGNVGSFLLQNIAIGGLGGGDDYIRMVLDNNSGSGRRFDIFSRSDGLFGIRDADAGADRLIIDASGHVYPGTAKSQDCGTVGNEWDNVRCVTLTEGTSRLINSVMICPVCQEPMKKGTGSTVVIGEVADYEFVFCISCGNVAVETRDKQTPEMLAARRPPPKIMLKSIRTKSQGGHDYKVMVDFEFVADELDDEGNVVQPGVFNSTRLGDDELAMLTAMTTDDERKAFLLTLGEREWYAREEARMMQEHVDGLREQHEALVEKFVGVDLLQ